MRLGPFEITRRKAASLMSVDQRGGWWPLIREATTGAWQTNQTISIDTVLTYSTVYACVTLIASDIAKCRLRLVELTREGIWEEVEVAAFSPVLRKPNHYQDRIQFIQAWITSKLIHGNTYVLKQRDQRRVVTDLYVLNPLAVTVLVAPDGSVFYSVKRDELHQITGAKEVLFPAREIIHDRMTPLYHDLVGVSPITAGGLAALQGLSIQNNSNRFFSSGATPSGILTAPGAISQATADRLKTYFETEFVGENVGKIAVAGDGLKYEALTMKSVDAQLIEQLKWTAETVCSVYHVPPYMVGVGPPPNYNNIEALNAQYYAQGLQILIESLELCLDFGLELPGAADFGKTADGRTYGTEFDLDDLLRTDTATLIESEKNASGIKAPNESRKRLGLPPVAGGETPYLQEQQWPIRLLADRALPTREPSPTPTPPASMPGDDSDEMPEMADERDVSDLLRKELAA